MLTVTGRYMLVGGLSADETVETLERFCDELPDPRFSDRLTHNRKEVSRIIRKKVKAMGDGTQDMPRPDEAREKLTASLQAWRSKGFVPWDKTTWQNYKVYNPPVDFDWTDGERAAIEARIRPILNTDLETALAATKTLIAFVRSHPGAEIAVVGLPSLLKGFSINWGYRYKKNQFLQELLPVKSNGEPGLGWLQVTAEAKWHPRGSKKKGRARTYAVGPVLAYKFRAGRGEARPRKPMPEWLEGELVYSGM